MAKQLDSFWVKWGVTLIVASLLSALAARYAYFPGDVEFTRFAQSIFPANLTWARAITDSAEWPLSVGLLALIVAISWRLAGRRAGLLAIASFAVLVALSPLLKELIERPRPSRSLVRVTGSPSGYSFPSGFAMTYASTLGYLLSLALTRRQSTSDGWRRFITITCLLLLIAGGIARIVLGAHWLSDVLGGYLIGFVWAALLIRIALK